MTAPAVRVERSGTVAILTLNRPEALNALNAAVLSGLRTGLDSARSDPTVRVVVVTGAGDRAFCAGADLRELQGRNLVDAREAIVAGQEVMRSVERAGLPVIAAVNGLALGGGFELVLACTFPVLASHASLGLPEAGLGLIPGYGGTQRLPRAVGRAAAAHIMLTGERLSADRAYALGLTPVPPVAPEELMARALSIAESVAAKGPAAARAILELLSHGADAPLDAGLALETGYAAGAVAGEESTEGIAAFLDRRPARFSDLPSAAEPT